MTAKRDFLKGLEAKYQAEWERDGVFHVDAPSLQEFPFGTDPNEIRKVHPKFMSTFPFPYQNGRLHLGHAFSFSKCEFATGYERLCGKRALLPFGLHGTGMPIKACADKLKREIEMFGSMFDCMDGIEDMSKLSIKEGTSAPPAHKHSKVAAKSGKSVYQFEIMLQNGVPREEIHRFADPIYWLYYFPAFTKKDANALGCKVDWRRTFFTTDANPYFDSFVCWQFRCLRKLDKIKFGKRYTIYSPLDGQPCMDHDRASGEAVGPQDCLAIKMQVLEWSGEAEPLMQAMPGLTGKNIFMVAATLRPETLYGQTNCFVSVNIDYGLFQSKDADDVFLVTDRAARNMAYQGQFAKEGVMEKIGSVNGKVLVGTRVRAPTSTYSEVYVMPMENVLATKGTGVVCSVPSASPDDYAAVRDLVKKCAYYGIQESWIVPFVPVPVFKTPTYGDMITQALCAELKINSQKDKEQLALAKEIAYKEGYYNGVMVAGAFKGRPAHEAKPLARAALIASGDAFPYSEPERTVISRSGDECVVSLFDQWYLDYGEHEWKKLAERCLERMDTYCQETRHQFQGTLNWLVQWAFARSYGLGTKLPWDKQFLIESLSDSTIYMAYYTVAHLLHQGSFDGSMIGPLGIKPEEMTDEVWDYIFREGGPPKESRISIEKLQIMRREFEYFYPMDLRTSGKDLIPNHLTFLIYNHVAMFPHKNWPLGVRANGHLLLNGKKMSKSEGNFLTLFDAVERYGADAIRLALADAGDGIEDGNFEESTANAAILRLYTLIEWIQETVQMAQAGKLRSGPRDERFHDRAFEAEMNNLMRRADHAYSRMLYRDALKYGFYELQLARDWYREGMPAEEMHCDLVLKYVEYQTIALAPIAPHWSEFVWREILKKPTTIMIAKWPEVPAAEMSILHAVDYVKKLVRSVRELEAGAAKKLAKAKSGKVGGGGGRALGVDFDPSKPKRMAVLVAKEFPVWQDSVIDVMKAHYDAVTKEFDDKNLMKTMKDQGLMKDKRVMPFLQEMKKRIGANGPIAFDRALLFDEVEVLRWCADFLQRSLKYETFAIIATEEVSEKDRCTAEIAVPGEPSFVFENAG